MLVDDMRKLAEDNSDLVSAYDNALKDIRKAAEEGELSIAFIGDDDQDVSFLMYLGRRLKEEGFDVCLIEGDEDTEEDTRLDVYWA